MLENQLEKHLPDFSNMGEAQKTYLIDYFKDKVVANPSDFGLEDADVLKEGRQINFSSLFEGADQAASRLIPQSWLP